MSVALGAYHGFRHLRSSSRNLLIVDWVTIYGRLFHDELPPTATMLEAMHKAARSGVWVRQHILKPHNPSNPYPRQPNQLFEDDLLYLRHKGRACVHKDCALQRLQLGSG